MVSIWRAVVLSSIAISAPTFAVETTVAGRWQLDPTQSTIPADELEGIRASKKKRSDPRSSSSAGKRQKASDRAHDRYWMIANEGSEWSHSKELVHAGPLQRLLESENLEIVATESGFLFIYADGFEREIRPNPGGRVFTASGDELVADEIGFTLTYWDKEDLVLETRIKKGGKLNERITLDENGETLVIAIEIDRRDWKWIAKVNRVFNRVSTN